MLLNILEVVIVVLCCCAASVQGLHCLQRERYLLPGYSQWLKRNRDHVLKGYVLWGVLGMGVKWYLPMLLSLFIPVEALRENVAWWMTVLLFVGVTVFEFIADHRENAHKPFVFTRRIQRLMAVFALLCTAIVLLLDLVGIPGYLAYAGVPYLVWLSGRIMDPVEARINMGFYNEARKKLAARPDLIKIGITGSYGKTATKFILRGILSRKFEVLMTPASFNTAMGIARTVNDSLKQKHQVFIAEMGARHVGDIKNLVKLVQPTYGMLTGIGPQHLDSFGSMANIADTKFELMDGLPKDGAAFFAADSGYSDRLYARCTRTKHRVGVDIEGEFFTRATELKFTPQGTKFLLTFADGAVLRCRTRLLGRYNVQNIAMAAALARQLGMEYADIGAAIAALPPFEHKLQLVPGDRVFIDDTLNTTPESTAEALNVLTEMPGERILVTSGLSDELPHADEHNYAYGTQIPGCADVVVLVTEENPRTHPLYRALIDSGFPRSSIHTVSDLRDVDALLSEIAAPTATILQNAAS